MTLIRVQARFRGLILRKKVKSMIIQSSDLKNTTNNRFTKTTEEKIVFLDFRILKNNFSFNNFFYFPQNKIEFIKIVNLS